MTLSKKISLILGILMLTSLLSACAKLSRPATMTIEYDEEVKLHDGEMIWVHITRHYRMVGGFASGHGKSYMPGEVEISWDTGFEGVGRKSVYFGALVTIDKYDNTWYIGGAKNNNMEDKGNSISCDKYGTIVEGYKCVNAINKDGFLTQDLTKNSFLLQLKRNIFYPDSVPKSLLSRENLDSSKLDWDKKKSLQKNLLKNYADIPLNSSWINSI